MSKSIGNVIIPSDYLKNKRAKTKLSPDTLRLWVISSDFTKDVSLSDAIINKV